VTSVRLEAPSHNTQRPLRRRGLERRQGLRQPEAQPEDEGGRRALNLLVASLGLLLTAPVMVLVACVVKLSSRGPVLYAQTRVGLDRRSRRSPRETTRRRSNMGGRPFRIYKFRTMSAPSAGAEGAGAEVWARPNDPRITRVGRVLRSTRLDELPQLWNVLRGDMNIVGPRPEQPGIFVNLRQQIERYQDRQRVRPGITGWAQINQAYDSCLEDVRRKVALDLEYISKRSTLEDLKIMALTVPVMVFRKGAC